jgi:hypothetical protein
MGEIDKKMNENAIFQKSVFRVLKYAINGSNPNKWGLPPSQKQNK